MREPSRRTSKPWTAGARRLRQRVQAGLWPDGLCGGRPGAQRRPPRRRLGRLHHHLMRGSELDIQSLKVDKE